jgi:putative sigma-54 modulation protein
MQITISSKHLELTGAIEEYARKKLEKFVRYFDRVQQVDAVIDRARNGYTVEIITDVEHHDPIIAHSTHEDLYACIDLGIDRSVRQLKDHKSRLRDSKHHTPTGGKEL